MELRKTVAALSGIAMLALAASAMGVPFAAGGQNDNDPVALEIRNYALTLDKAQKAATAMQSINQLIAANPALSGAMHASPDAAKETITQAAQTIDSKYPQVAAIIQQNGLQTREFLVILGAFINDFELVILKKQGKIPSYPPGMITPQNIALIEGNWPAFKAIAEKIAPPTGN
ncbi:MAG: hypothetical protein WAL45_04110 [Terracidiphilus sp.]